MNKKLISKVPAWTKLLLDPLLLHLINSSLDSQPKKKKKKTHPLILNQNKFSTFKKKKFRNQKIWILWDLTQLDEKTILNINES